MLIKYSHKNKAKNYTSDSDGKYVLPYIRQRIHYQLLINLVKYSG